MDFKDHLKLHGFGEEFLSPDGLLARITSTPETFLNLMKPHDASHL